MNPIAVLPVIQVEADIQTPPQSPKANNPKILWAPVKDYSRYQRQLSQKNVERIAALGRIAFSTR